MELPEWFTDEIAESVMGKDKYRNKFEKEYDHVYYETRNRQTARYRAFEITFSYAYGFFIGYTGAILNGGNQTLISQLTEITGQSETDLQELIRKENENSSETRESRLEDSVRSLPEDELVNL